MELVSVRLHDDAELTQVSVRTPHESPVVMMHGNLPPNVGVAGSIEDLEHLVLQFALGPAVPIVEIDRQPPGNGASWPPLRTGFPEHLKQFGAGGQPSNDRVFGESLNRRRWEDAPEIEERSGNRGRWDAVHLDHVVVGQELGSDERVVGRPASSGQVSEDLYIPRREETEQARGRAASGHRPVPHGEPSRLHLEPVALGRSPAAEDALVQDLELPRSQTAIDRASRDAVVLGSTAGEGSVMLDGESSSSARSIHALEAMASSKPIRTSPSVARAIKWLI